MVLLRMLTEPPVTANAPPKEIPRFALAERTHVLIVSAPALLKIPPPLSAAELPEMMLLLMVSTPPLAMPPPSSPKLLLLDIVLLLMVSIPALLIPAPVLA